ncbi:MAG: aminoglycoside 6-adenylyltransferase, partial [Clostridia bacterium]|nr:aminoglycoside 6-adenylyltransferase [Clostridia bacterium]
ATYPDAQYPHIWNAFDAVARLWHEVGNRIAEKCGFEYPHETEQRMLVFIHNLGDLK